MTEHDKFVTPEMVARLQTDMKRDPQETFSMSYVRDNYLASRDTIDQAACFEAGWDAARAYAHAAQSDGWQPIATAPKDGTQILVAYAGCAWVEIASYDEDLRAWMITNDDAADELPTYWQPIPSPPSKQEGG